MPKVDPTVKRETVFIGVSVCILSLLLQAVFLICRIWDYTVMLGNLWGGGVAVLNFFVMGLTLQNAVKQDEKKAADMMKLSQRLRMPALLAAAAVGFLLPCFNPWAVIMPLFFPRIAIAFRPLLDKK